jgi:long-chain acyl-CoA synthetase
MQKIWLKQYPAGVPAEARTDLYPTLAALLEDSLRKHRELPACRCLGRVVTYGEIDDSSRALAAWLQGLGLARGERVAVMLPNVPQMLVVVAALVRTGLVVVNVNPQTSARELELQLKDAGVRAVVAIEQAAATLQQALGDKPTQHLLLARMGDMLGPLRGALANARARRGQAALPRLPGAVRWRDALARGRRMALAPVALQPDDIAVLQYTGGTTGVSKGAVLLHRQLVANLLQAQAWYRPALARVPAGEQLLTAGALPLHHIFGFNLIMLLNLHLGGCTLLFPDTTDIGAMLKALARQRVHSFPAVDALYADIAAHPACDSADWSALRLCVGGGMPVRPATARRWQEKTGCVVCEGYGLSETSPAVTCNPVDSAAFSGHIGLPLPSTEVALLDDAGHEVPIGTPGELAVRGPQVMAGYWQRPDETAKVMAPGGWLRSGDIATMDERGNFRIVDRKKDMILVSGFNVYPNEVEDVVTQMPGVLACAAVGVPDARAGEAVKVVVVRQQPSSASPTEADVRAWCEANLTGYKRPRVVEFRAELPRTPVGKVLRRVLREAG